MDSRGVSKSMAESEQEGKQVPVVDVSRSKDSFFRCDECRHEYSFRINSAYLLTTRRTSSPGRELTRSYSNGANSHDIHGDSIHIRHPD